MLFVCCFYSKNSVFLYFLFASKKFSTSNSNFSAGLISNHSAGIQIFIIFYHDSGQKRYTEHTYHSEELIINVTVC